MFCPLADPEKAVAAGRGVGRGPGRPFCSSGVSTIPRRFKPQPRDTGKRLRVNEQIRVSPLRLIDEDDNPVGIVDVNDARDRARRAGLDLVEVAPKADPPVCKIMDYGKWKYAQRKKEQKAKSHAKQSELKGMRLRPKIDSHDLGIKVAKARTFLEDGDKVQFTMLFRGREMAHQDLGMKTMREVFDTLQDVAKVEAMPKMQGRRMTMLLTPDRKKPAKEEPAPAPAEQAVEA
ncbi:MAG: translation initiation factor IF-3 [Planctomycetota bacterium]